MHAMLRGLAVSCVGRGARGPWRVLVRGTKHGDGPRWFDTARANNGVTPSRRQTLEASTVALYHFDEGAGTSATDEVGPGRHPAMLDMGATLAPE
jgi:hypothetical protein